MGGRRGIVVVVGLLALGFAHADAALVICKRRNAIKLRDTTCKPKEQAVDPAALGVTPSGPAGGVLSGTYPNPGLGSALTAPPSGPAGGALTGSYPAPTLAAGAIVSTAAFAAGVVPAARVAHTSSTAINGGHQTVSWEQEEFDTAGLFSAGAPTVMTAPVAGLYQVDVGVSVQAMTAGSFALVKLKIVGASGVEAASQAHEASGAAGLSASALLALDAGQQVTVIVDTNSGGSPGLVSDPGFLAMHWVGPQ